MRCENKIIKSFLKGRTLRNFKSTQKEIFEYDLNGKKKEKEEGKEKSQKEKKEKV